MLAFRDERDFDRARDVLRAADYTEAGIGRALGREQILGMPTSELPQALRRTRDPSPLHTLVRLFFLGVPAPIQAARDALAPMPLDAWAEAGLLGLLDSDRQVAGQVQLWPLEGLMLAVDLPWMRTGPVASDFVLPPGPITTQLAHVMVRRPCERALDLGTGSGALALMAAPHAQTVTATDMNERAVQFTRFNARLNRTGNVRCLAGNLFEPVAGERFGLIVCNPPFVISPTQRFLFRDSGERGDVFCRRLARAAVEHLETGGFFQFTANLAHQAGRPWRSDLEAWFEGLGCDVLVLVKSTETASEYAMTWILSTESKDVGVVPRLYDDWMTYFEREGIEAVSYVFVAMRRAAAGKTWIHVDDPPCWIHGPCGDEVLRFFECRDAFGGPDRVEDLLGARPRLSPQIKIEQEYSAASGRLELSHVRVQKTGGLQYPLAIHPNVARLLANCDGARTVGQLLQEMAAGLGVDRDRAESAILPVVRSMLERGVLLAGDGAEG